MNKKAERREKSPRTELRLWLGGEKRFIHPPKAAFIAVLYCMHGQRDEKGIMSTPKRKKHHIDYTHIKKNEQKELGDRGVGEV